MNFTVYKTYLNFLMGENGTSVNWYETRKLFCAGSPHAVASHQEP